MLSFYHCALFQVQIGDVRSVEWRLGTPYEDLTLPEGTGLIFHWSGSYHNLLEMSSPVESDCKFVNNNSVLLGQVRILCPSYLIYLLVALCRSIQSG